MTPLTVRAHLDTPPVLDRPLYLDALLQAGLGEAMGRGREDGWEDPEVVQGAPLPLARVETPHGWWWAASHVLPAGPEQQGHLNRVPLVEEYARWTDARSVSHGSGPDKRLRVPFYYRPGMLLLEWTCVGDLRQVARVLAHVPGVGRLRGHGHGWVRRWEVVPGGPSLEDYGHDLALRHLPAEMRVTLPRAVMRRHMPLRPPYYQRRDAVPCWQLQRAPWFGEVRPC